VNHTHDEDYLTETLIAAGCYDLKIISVMHDNLQWALHGEYVHSVTGAVIVLDFQELKKAYKGRRERRSLQQVIHHGHDYLSSNMSPSVSVETPASVSAHLPNSDEEINVDGDSKERIQPDDTPPATPLY
jgi:hypothetical protein